MAIRGPKNQSASSTVHSRLKFRINALIDERNTRRNLSEDTFSLLQNGKFNFGAFQMNQMVSRTPCATFGGPFANFRAGP